MVVGDFVPVSSNNTFRALGYAEELPDLGWMPIVLTKDPQHTSWTIDSDLEAPCRTVQVSGSRIVWRLWKKFVKDTPIAKLVPESLVADRVRSWIPFAVAKGVGLVLWHRIPVIFGSFQPWSALATAYLISKMTNRPLVAEFRDPVLSVAGTSPDSRRRLGLARRIASHAKIVIATSDEISADISKLAEGKLKTPPVVLPHGFRKTDRRTPLVPPLGEKFVLSFTGTLYDHECLDTLCAAIAELVRDRPELASRVHLKVIGREKKRSFELLKRRAAVYGIQEFLELVPWQSQTSLRAMIEDSHIVWCTDTLGGSGKGVIIPGKLAKLFAYGRPVMALCRPDGATWRAVTETGAGGSFDYSDHEGVCKFITGIYETAANGGAPFVRNEIAVDEYSFRNLTAKLAGLIDNETTRKGSPK